MKYNSIGEQLIAKAKELDPNYKPDKFNDMSEAIDILLNNSGGGSSSGDILDIGPYLIFNDGSDDEGIISQEGYEKLNSSNGKIIIAHFTNEMFDIDYPFVFEKWQEIDGTVYFVFYGIEIDSKSFKQYKKGILTINMNTKTFVADYENISENISDNLIFPTTSPSSQVIPSITTSNEQQNLTIGDGLEIKGGALISNLHNFKYGTLYLRNIIQGDKRINIELSFFDYIYDFLINTASERFGTSLTRDTFPSFIKNNISIELLNTLIHGVLYIVGIFKMRPYFDISIEIAGTDFYNCSAQDENSTITLFVANKTIPLNTGISFDDNFVVEYSSSWYGD